MTNHYTDVCEETIKSLRQQLEQAHADIAGLHDQLEEPQIAQDDYRLNKLELEQLRQQLDDSQTQLKWVKTTYEGLKSRVHNPSGYLKQISELRQKLDVARGLLDCSSGWIRFGSSKERDMYTKIQAFLKEQS